MHRLMPLAAVITFAAACAEPPVSSYARTAAAISDGASDGNPHFFFLPPMVANPGAGDNDATLSPAVVVCEWDGTVCVATLATFTTDRATTTTTHPGNSETVRVNRAHAIVNWHTGKFDVDPDNTYRICVKVGDVELGFADVDVVASGGDQKDAAEGFVAVVNGRTLPIKFRIEPGALDEPGGGGCGAGDT
jgi:hypothetical protein